MKRRKLLRSWRQYRRERPFHDLAEVLYRTMNGSVTGGLSRTWTYEPNIVWPPVTLTFERRQLLAAIKEEEPAQ